MLVAPQTGSRLFLAVAQGLFREGLKSVLQQDGFEVVGEASDGHTALQNCIRLKPRIVILEVGLPMLNGIDVAHEVRKSCRDTKAILLTSCDDEVHILAGLRAGVSGYVLKSAGFSSLVQAIQAALNREIYLSPAVLRTVVDAYVANAGPPLDPLTGRERQILQLIAEERNMKEIGAMLGISAKTADTHRGRIMRKLNIFSTAGLVRYTLKHGLLVEQKIAENPALSKTARTSFATD